MYSDKPHLYGNALSSVNVLRVGEKAERLEESKGEEEVEPLEEGGDGEGKEWRDEKGVPEAAEARKKHFLGKGKTEEWEWEVGRVYKADFFNPYLDFNRKLDLSMLSSSEGDYGLLTLNLCDRVRHEITRLQPLDTAIFGRRGLSEIRPQRQRYGRSAFRGSLHPVEERGCREGGSGRGEVKGINRGKRRIKARRDERL